MKIKKFSIAVQVILLHIFFLLLHYSFDWWPNAFTKVFSGIDESVYQHMKIAFFSVLLLVILEYLVTRPSRQNLKTWLTARLFTCSFLPLVMMPIYLSGPLFFGQIESILGEIIFANIALAVTSLISFVTQDHIEKSSPKVLFMILVAVLFLLSAAQYITFTYHLPWFDIFAIPPGW
jgi:hypothetical protein